MEKAYSSSAPELLHFAGWRAHWLALARSAHEAIAEFDRLIVIAAQSRDSDVARPIDLRRRRAEWVRRSGATAAAERDLAELLVEAQTALGPRHTVTQKIETDAKRHNGD